MLPYLKLFGLTIPSYGICIMLGVLLGMSVALFLPARKSISKEDLLFSACYAGIGIFIGAKLLYLITVLPQITENWSILIEKPSLLFGMLSGGFVFYGGVIGGLIGLFIYTKKFKLDLFETVDILTPSFPLIHSFGRLGCFLAGCCYGIPAPPPFGLLFNNSPIAPHNVHLFPVQLLESGLNFLLFVFLFVYARKTKAKGNVFVLYILLYAIERFILEYFRFDSDRGFLLWFSTSQWISILLILGCLLLFVRKVKAQKIDFEYSRFLQDFIFRNYL